MSIPLAQRAGAPEFVPFPGEHHGIEWEPLTASRFLRAWRHAIIRRTAPARTR